MTTILYHWNRGIGIIASDSRLTDGGILIADNNIKTVVTDKVIAAAAGDAIPCDLFMDWVKNGMKENDKPDFDEDDTLDAFTVDKDGYVVAYNIDMKPCRLGKARFYAVGSGGDFALGALMHIIHHQADNYNSLWGLEESMFYAVRSALKIDMNSGGDINYVSTKDILDKANKKKNNTKKVNK